MAAQLYIILSALLVISSAQRSPYAGRRPVGYPELQTTTTTTTLSDELGNRLGEVQSTPTTTTMRLPVEALGDKNLVEQLSKLPIDHQPFWFINAEHLDSYRQNPQTYHQRPTGFVDFFNSNIGAQAVQF